MVRIPAWTLLLSALPSLLPAVAADPPRNGYIVFPIGSALQKEYLFEPSDRCLLVVHGDSLVGADGKLDAERLNFDEVSRDVRDVRVRAGGKVQTQVIYAKDPPEAVKRLVSLALLGWMNESGYERDTPTTYIGDQDWQLAVKLVGEARGLYEESLDENPLGDDKLKVYPVRNQLSRLRTDNADCVVLFPQPFDKDSTGTLDEETRLKVKELVASLKIKELNRVEFGIFKNRDYNKEAVELFDRKTARELAMLLGVKRYGVTQIDAR